MAKVTTSLRVSEDLLTWARDYADERGVSVTALMEAALLGLRDDSRAGVPELPEPEAVPSAESKGTAHWRDPTPAELADAKERYPDLPPERLKRLARAEAHMTDMGLPDATANPTQDSPSGPGLKRQGGDFSRLTHARGEFFADLRTPDSISGKVRKPSR